MSDSAPLSFAQRASNLASNQPMPLQRSKPAQAAAPKKAAAAPSAALTSPTAASASASAASAAPSNGPPLKSPTKPAAAASPAQPPSKPATASAAPTQPAASAPSPQPAATPGTGPIKVVKAPKEGYALVTAVSSGDTLIVIGSRTAAGQKTPEKFIIASGIQAPKFAKGKNQKDEPFAWESREYLRKRVLGKQIKFNIGYTHEDSGREYATVWVDGDNLAVDIVQHGWAKVKTGTNKDGKERTGPEELVAAQREAQEAGRGLWLKGAKEEHHIRTINWTPDPRALYEAHKGQPIPAVVDQVRDGSTLRVELLNGSEPLQHTSIFLHLAGVQCPRTPLPLSVLQSQHDARVKEGKKPGARPEEEGAAEPYAIEAQEFTERALLNRDVNVLLQGTDKLGNFFGTIQFPKGNISVKLLEKGFGKLVPWSAQLTSNAEELKAAEAKARTGKLGVWGAADAEATSGGSASGAHDYQGKVIQVLSGDALLVQDNEGVERRVSLASIRSPRLGRRGDKDEPWAVEAKEHMRSKLVGHKVKVVTEYVRSAPAESKDQEQRQYVTVFLAKANMNESLVAAGLAEVIRHRVDEERSQFYDAYLSAEHAAQEAGRGRFGKKAVSQKYVDLTDKPRPDRRPKKEAADTPAGDEAEAAEDTAEKKVDPAAEEKANKAKALSLKAKQYLSFFQRDSNISAVVEYVFTPSRFKLAVPKESVYIAFALAGIRTPAAKDAQGVTDKNFERALQYVRSRILQHTVRIEVETLDRGDNFLGSLFHGKSNLAVDLLKDGLAEVVDFSARKSPHNQELFAAEAEAKINKRGIWENYVPPVNEEKTAVTADSSAVEQPADGKELVAVSVTEIEDANDFYVHFVGDKGVEFVESKLREYGESVGDAASDYKPHSGAVCAGQFNDGNWYRVRVEGAFGDAYRVFFLDYGNHDQLGGDKLRPLPAELTKIPALAHHATLAAVSAPKGEDYREAAALAFNDLVWGQELLAKVELVDFNKLLHLTLHHESSPVSINKQLLRDGNARVAARPAGKLRDLVGELREHEEFAKQNHYNVWEYGDVSDEEEEKPVAPVQRGRK